MEFFTLADKAWPNIQSNKLETPCKDEATAPALHNSIIEYGYKRGVAAAHIFQFYLQNVNGLNFFNEGARIEQTLYFLKENNVVAWGMEEPNLNMAHPSTMDCLNAHVKDKWRVI